MAMTICAASGVTKREQNSVTSISKCGVHDVQQRNFLKVYDQMCKAMRFDYIDAPSFVYSGYGKYEGMLESLNPIMFESPAICDKKLTQIMLEFLSWYCDPTLHLLVGSGAACAPFSLGYHVMRYKDALYVDRAVEGSPLVKGDRIIRVNGKTLEEIFPEVKRVLMSKNSCEREDWSIVLGYARNYEVVHANGAHEIREDDCPHVKVPVENKHVTIGEPSAVPHDDGVLVMKLERDDMAGLGVKARKQIERASGATKLIIDARGVCGGTVDDACALLPLLVDQPTSYRDLFGSSTLLMNASRKNVTDRITLLKKQRAQVTDSQCKIIDDLIEDLKEHQDKGLMPVGEADAENAVVSPSDFSSDQVIILIDRETADAAEWLVRAASVCKKVIVIGRATCGSIDNTCLASRKLDDDFTLVYPTARYYWAKEDSKATRGCGIEPDIHLAWTPQFLNEDVDMKCALACCNS